MNYETMFDNPFGQADTAFDAAYADSQVLPGHNRSILTLACAICTPSGETNNGLVEVTNSEERGYVSISIGELVQEDDFNYPATIVDVAIPPALAVRLATAILLAAQQAVEFNSKNLSEDF